jgi:hypothetical protein
VEVTVLRFIALRALRAASLLLGLVVMLTFIVQAMPAPACGDVPGCEIRIVCVLTPVRPAVPCGCLLPLR